MNGMNKNPSRGVGDYPHPNINLPSEHVVINGAVGMNGMNKDPSRGVGGMAFTPVKPMT